MARSKDALTKIAAYLEMESIVGKQPKELTPEQRAFLDKFITGLDPTEQKRITQGYLTYRQRYDEVVARINKIEPGHPQRQDLERRLKSEADGPANKGDLAAAYQALAGIGKTAKNLANGYVLGLSPDQLSKEVGEAQKNVAAIRGEFLAVRDGMTILIQEVLEHPKASDYDDSKEVFAFRRALPDTEADWRGDLEALRSRAESLAQRSDAIQLQNTVQALPHRIKTMQELGNAQQRKAAQTFAKPVQVIVDNAKFDDQLLTSEFVMQAINERVAAFEGALRAVKDLDKFQMRDTASGQLRASIQALEQQEKDRMDRAKQAYSDAVQRDRALGLAGAPAQPRNQQAPAREPLRTFHPYMVLESDLDELGDAELDDARIAAAGKAAADKLNTLMSQEGSNSDVLFDLTVKSRDELKGALIESMFNWLDEPFAPNGMRLTAQRKKLIETLTDDLYQAIQTNMPNRASDDMSTITMKSDPPNPPKIYRNPKRIGEGGAGEVYRYTADDGQTVIVKALKADEGDESYSAEQGADELENKRRQMIDEMRIHRQIDGGENAHNPYVVPMKGAAVGKDGMLLMLMDEAKGGDLDSLSEAANELTRSGLIPEAARTAMVQRTMQQSVRALKAVHDAGAMHLDVKAKNFLLDANGNVQIADFGSARPVDQDGKAETSEVPTTQYYAPKEYGKKLSQAEEVFWLGSQLQTMSSDVQAEGTIIDMPWTGDMVKARTKDADGKVHTQTAFDRLRNAMLDPDPAKRPSLDSVLLSSYLGDVDNAYKDEDVARLMRTLTNYNRAVGQDLVKITAHMNDIRGRIARAQLPGNAATPQQRAEAERNAEEWRAQLADLQAKLNAINARSDVKLLLAEIKRAGEAFTVISAAPPAFAFEAQDQVVIRDELSARPAVRR